MGDRKPSHEKRRKLKKKIIEVKTKISRDINMPKCSAISIHARQILNAFLSVFNG